MGRRGTSFYLLPMAPTVGTPTIASWNRYVIDQISPLLNRSWFIMSTSKSPPFNLHDFYNPALFGIPYGVVRRLFSLSHYLWHPKFLSRKPTPVIITEFSLYQSQPKTIEIKLIMSNDPSVPSFRIVLTPQSCCFFPPRCGDTLVFVWKKDHLW